MSSILRISPEGVLTYPAFKSYLGHCANKEHPLFKLGEALSRILVQGYECLSGYTVPVGDERWGLQSWNISLLQSLTVATYNKLGDSVAT